MLTPEKQRVLELFSEGRRAYKLMEFKQALEFFRKALEIDPQDGPSSVYLERCQHYLTEPPADDWDGVFTMKTK